MTGTQTNEGQLSLAEHSHAQSSFWERIAQFFIDLWDAIVHLFTGDDDEASIEDNSITITPHPFPRVQAIERIIVKCNLNRWEQLSREDFATWYDNTLAIATSLDVEEQDNYYELIEQTRDHLYDHTQEGALRNIKMTLRAHLYARLYTNYLKNGDVSSDTLYDALLQMHNDVLAPAIQYQSSSPFLMHVDYLHYMLTFVQPRFDQEMKSLRETWIRYQQNPIGHGLNELGNLRRKSLTNLLGVNCVLEAVHAKAKARSREGTPSKTSPPCTPGPIR